MMTYDDFRRAPKVPAGPREGFARPLIGLTGRVFDVRRFSTHDGSGIRTTVFFKGCPLRCAWCHNPEGIGFARRPAWFSGRCIHCESCVKASQHGGITRDGEGVHIHERCPEDWDAVMDACPTGALRWDSRDVSVDALFAEIERDAPFFAHGGGVTLSGGDPLAQPRFARALLERCKEAGFHTAIETELYAPPTVVQAVLPLCDQIYVDLKLYDLVLHIKYTGVSNVSILDRFQSLLSSDLRNRVIVRTPLIPGITATRDNLLEIGRFLCRIHPDTHWELLNYNPLAAAKYPMTGRRYSLPETTPRYTASQMAAFREIARETGLRNIITE